MGIAAWDLPVTITPPPTARSFANGVSRVGVAEQQRVRLIEQPAWGDPRGASGLPTGAPMPKKSCSRTPRSHSLRALVFQPYRACGEST